MAKISFLLFVAILITILQAHEAHRVGKFDEAFEKDLHKAETMIEEDLKAKKMNIQGLTSEVETLRKSEVTLNQLENAHKKDQDLTPYVKKLKTFSKVAAKTTKSATSPPPPPSSPPPAPKKKPASIIQSILKDLGLNRRK